MLEKLNEEELKSISKGVNYVQRLKYLKNKYHGQRKNPKQKEQ